LAAPRGDTSLQRMVQDPGSTPKRGDSVLDGPAARAVAFLVFLGVVGLLGWMHRDDLFPPDRAAVEADDPVARCVAARAQDIDRMQTEGTIGAEQARLFKARAEALCQDQFGKGSGPPPQ
jgi:hypothetical protein